MTVEKVVSVAAAGEGMGAAIAKDLAESGYRVALISPSGSAAAELAREPGGFGVAGSVAEAADIDRFVLKTLAKYGRIGAVVNNTGHPPKGDLLAIEDNKWHRFWPGRNSRRPRTRFPSGRLSVNKCI